MARGAAAAAAGGTVVIEVSDHGMGIPRDEIAQVTRRFFRGRGAGTGGSGLGLAIADRIARDHGGTAGHRERGGRRERRSG